ncbi:MAG: efflux RND transporter periplasmic adaptor subunit [Candidatus Hydrogenedentes bacterium]|nr:efflux RND transporter periplasmic adaptor subunit [Candidatus Hydrogenedentota bacterium]
MKRHNVAMAALSVGVLALGVLAMAVLISLKRPPAEASKGERAVSVEAMRVQPEDVPITITGYGEVRPLNVVSIAPEVPGKVVAVHPNLEVGKIVLKGETLFAIDPRTYETQKADTEAMVAQFQKTIQKVQTQRANDQERLKTLQRSRELANAEFQRVKELFEKDEVGTRSGVDAAERGFNLASDQAHQLEEGLEVAAVQIQEAQSAMASAQAKLEMAELNLQRTRVLAPFDARVRSVRLEQGQYVTPGVEVLSLADDSVLHISVPLDSRDARHWLKFNGHQAAADAAWFHDVEPVTCTIRWTEDKSAHVWEGVLDRVEKFDQATRTLTVALRIEGSNALSKDAEQLPLVEGMFCLVEIPGKTLTGAYRLPRWAVSFENTVYLAVENRLRTVPVEVARTEGESVFVSGGLNAGDAVITTRLVSPLENSLLHLSVSEPASGPAS